jgi:hypothetical protein
MPEGDREMSLSFRVVRVILDAFIVIWCCLLEHLREVGQRGNMTDAVFLYGWMFAQRSQGA